MVPGKCRRFPLSVAALAVAVVVFAGCGRSGDARLAAGLAALREGHIDEAVRHLEAARVALPANASLHCNLGIAYWEVGKTSRAVDELMKAAELTDDPRPHVYLVQMFGILKRWDDARDAFNEATKRMDAPSPRLLTAMALAEYRSGNNEAAVQFLQKALTTEPDYPPALFSLAFLYRDRVDARNQAIEYFQRYIEEADDSEHITAAEDILERLALESYPPSDNVDGTVTPPNGTRYARRPSDELIQKARDAVKSQVFDEAVVLLKEAVAKDRTNACAMWELAVLYDKHIKNTERANETYAEFARLFPRDPRALRALGTDRKREVALARDEFRKGVVAYAGEDIEGAIEHYRQALSADNRFVGASYNLGLAYNAKKDYEQARQEFTYTLAVYPDMLDANYMLGTVYRKLDAPHKAIEYLNRTLKLKPNHATAHMHLGYAYQSIGQHDTARTYFERYVALAPNDTAARRLAEWLQQNSRRR